MWGCHITDTTVSDIRTTFKCRINQDAINIEGMIVQPVKVHVVWNGNKFELFCS